MSFVIKTPSVIALFAILAGACNPKPLPGDTDTQTTVTSENSGTTGLTSDVPTTMITDSGVSDSMSSTLGPTEFTSTSMAPTTSDTETTQEPCEDSRVPTCMVCNVMGQPQRLFGLTWNFAGEPSDRLGETELRCIVLETAHSQPIATIPGMDPPTYINAYDREANILYAVALSKQDHVMNLFTINTITGELLGKPPVETLEWSSSLHVRSDGKLVGLVIQAEMTHDLRFVDPLTGQSSVIAEFPQISLLHFMAATYDRLDDRLYTIGWVNGNDDHLFVIDAMDGTLLGDPAFAESITWDTGLYLRADKQLVGLGRIEGVTNLFTINKATAEITVIASFPELMPNMPGATVYDDVTDTIIFVDAMSHLITINATSGDSSFGPQLAMPKPDHPYNWAGGLYTFP